MTKPSVAATFDALIEQTMQRGGSPSVRTISDAALASAQLLAACEWALQFERTDRGRAILSNAIAAAKGEE